MRVRARHHAPDLSEVISVGPFLNLCECVLSVCSRNLELYLRLFHAITELERPVKEQDDRERFRKLQHQIAIGRGEKRRVCRCMRLRVRTCLY